MDSLLSPDPSDIWKHRRRFAYSAGALLALITFRAMGPELSQPNADLLGNIAYALAGVIGAYIGFAVLDHASKRRNDTAMAAVGQPIDETDRAAANAPAREGD